MRRNRLHGDAVIVSLIWILLATVASAIEFHPAVGIVGRGTWRGTGTLISHNQDGRESLILTAAHVVDTHGDVWFGFPNGKRYRGYSLRGNRNADVATFVVHKIDVPAMPVWPGETPLGRTCWAEGHASIGSGRLRGTIARESPDGRCDFSIPSQSGDSGAAIYVVDTSGQPFVVGCITGYYHDNPQMTTGAGPRMIRGFLKGLSFDNSTAKCAVTETGHVFFGTGPIRRLLLGRNYPQPWSCPPGGWGSPPAAGQPLQQPQYVNPPRLVEEAPLSPPPPQNQAGSIQDRLRQQSELLEWQQKLLANCKPQPQPDPGPVYTLPGQLEAKFDTRQLKRELLEQMARDDRFRGRDGVDGRDGADGRDGLDGQPGEDGADGIDGVDGEVTDDQLAAITGALYQRLQDDPQFRGPPGPSAEVDVEALTATILSRLPDVRVDLVDPDGTRTSAKQSLSKGNALFEFRFKNKMNIATPKPRERSNGN